MNENNKAINNINTSIETKIGLLKSDLQLELRTIEDRIKLKVEEERKETVKKLNEIETNFQDKLDKSNEERAKAEKLNKVLIVVAIIIGIISVGTKFI